MDGSGSALKRPREEPQQRQTVEEDAEVSHAAARRRKVDSAFPADAVRKQLRRHGIAGGSAASVYLSAVLEEITRDILGAAAAAASRAPSASRSVINLGHLDELFARNADLQRLQVDLGGSQDPVELLRGTFVCVESLPGAGREDVVQSLRSVLPHAVAVDDGFNDATVLNYLASEAGQFAYGYLTCLCTLVLMQHAHFWSEAAWVGGGRLGPDGSRRPSFVSARSLLGCMALMAHCLACGQLSRDQAKTYMRLQDHLVERCKAEERACTEQWDSMESGGDSSSSGSSSPSPSSQGQAEHKSDGPGDGGKVGEEGDVEDEEGGGGDDGGAEESANGGGGGGDDDVDDDDDDDDDEEEEEEEEEGSGGSLFRPCVVVLYLDVEPEVAFRQLRSKSPQSVDREFFENLDDRIFEQCVAATNSLNIVVSSLDHPAPVLSIVRALADVRSGRRRAARVFLAGGRAAPDDARASQGGLPVWCRTAADISKLYGASLEMKTLPAIEWSPDGDGNAEPTCFVDSSLWLNPRNFFKRVVMSHLASGHSVCLTGQADPAVRRLFGTHTVAP